MCAQLPTAPPLNPIAAQSPDEGGLAADSGAAAPDTPLSVRFQK
ncbi:hypothetical protein NPE20_16465 [Mucilaginibacter sp. JC4]|uniref:Uncharacterized protein n=1 Tax=Mucilaginibacter aquariorum TaxID=2967225 RepID=A0ABT1T5A9_9SPHI|nr:hypothetical protein [Mucilaginibacter aquariorum]